MEIFDPIKFIISDNLSISIIVGCFLVCSGYALKHISIAKIHCVKSTMATFAIGVPLGILSLKKITMQSSEIIVFLMMLLLYFCLWGVAYVLETEIEHHNFKKWKAKFSRSIYVDILYIQIGLMSTKSLEFVNYITSNFIST